MLIFCNGEIVDTLDKPKGKKTPEPEGNNFLFFCICLIPLFISFFLGTRVHINEGRFVNKQINICEKELPRNLSCKPDKINFKIVNN